ncbi:DUF3025 domain-containing protein [Chitinimonas lacunae]|uniref:DUF3025 domain-containing protein n=1 Tax=Chitinimonas lacunae TaxID=1963018 RepID=A0ABV8MV48_9NEIS
MPPDWPSSLFAESPWFAALRPTLDRLGWSRFPAAADWAAASAGHCTVSAQPLCFAPAPDDGLAYEERIWRTGRVATRPDNWHDAFNALAWLAFPRSKAALNALHWRHLAHDPPGRRSRARDAATLFDESGVAVVASDPTLLAALRDHQWATLFQRRRADWGRQIEVWVLGHALSEKALAPFRGIVGKCALLEVSPTHFGRPTVERLDWVDQALAARCDDDSLTQPGALPPLPLLGIPGWWPQQDADFYADTGQFRPKRM